MSDDPPAFPDRPTRRHFSSPCKLAIIEEYERADDPGAKGAILRREGLDSSHIVEWRRARATALAATGRFSVRQWASSVAARGQF